MSKRFDTAEEDISEVNRWLEKLDVVSVGLWAGDPKQWEKAARISAATNPGHCNDYL